MHSYIAVGCADSSRWSMILLLSRYDWIPILAVKIETFLWFYNNDLYLTPSRNIWQLDLHIQLKAQVMMMATIHHYRALPHIPAS